MSRQRHPFRSQERDERCDPVIEWYLNTHGLDSGFECRDTFPSHDEADDVRLSLRRAGNHFGVSVAAWVTDRQGVSCWQDCRSLDGPHITHFTVHSKERGRAHVGAQAEGNAGRLRYNPYLRGPVRRAQRGSR